MSADVRAPIAVDNPLWPWLLSDSLEIERTDEDPVWVCQVCSPC